MGRSFVAYGLQLHCTFDLPLAPPRCVPGLPVVTIAMLSPSELQQLWSGSPRPPAWSGRLGDGQLLTLERGTRGDLLFSYGDRARFRFAPSQRRLQCVPLRDGWHWRRVLLGKIVCEVSNLLGYEALHAAAVQSPAGIVALAGPSGAGKSTLASEFLRRGWPLFADDVLTLSRGRGGVRGHPGTPHLTVPAGAPDQAALGTTIAELAGERWLAAHSWSERPLPVRMLCLLRRERGLALALTPQPANPLTLAPYMLGFRGDAQRQRRRFELYADLARAVDIVQVRCSLADPPARLADLIERALARTDPRVEADAPPRRGAAGCARRPKRPAATARALA
jgi:hypothetical protein